MSHGFPCKRLQSGAAGFTLIEVLAALLIFGVALVAFMQNIGESNRMQADLATRQRAEMLAQNIIEELRLSGEYKTGKDDGQFDGDDAIYHWATEIETDGDLDRLDHLTVTIAWNDGRDRSYALSTMVADVSEVESGTTVDNPTKTKAESREGSKAGSGAGSAAESTAGSRAK